MMLSGNTSKAGDSCRGLNESFLFSLTSALTPELDWLERGWWLGKGS